MPVTANEIEQYGGDPNIAFGSSSVPGGTGVVWDLSVSDKAWADYAANKLLVAREREAQLARKRLLAQAELQKKIDIGQYEILPQDKERFKIIWDEFRNDLKSGAAGGYLSGDPTNEDFNKIQDHLDKLEQFSKFSMQQQEDAKILKTQIAQDPNKYENADDVEAWLNIGDPNERAKSIVQLKAKFEGFNAVPYKKEILETLQNDNTNLKGEADRFNNVTYTVEGALNTNGVSEYAAATYDNDPNAQELANHLIVKAPEYYGTNPKAAFQKWSLDLAPESLQPIIRGMNFAPADIRNPQLAVQEQTNFPVNVAVSKPGYKVFEMKKGGEVTGYVVKDKSGKTVTFPEATITDASGKTSKQSNVSSFSKQSDAELAKRTSGGIKTGKVIRAWLPTKTAEFPSNILINPPQLAYDALTNAQITLDEIGTDAWTIDLADVEDLHRNKGSGALILEDDYATLSDSQKENYDVVRMATVKKPSGATYRIPYDNNISVPLANALRAAKVEFDLPSIDSSVPFPNSPKTQGTNQSSGKKKVTVAEIRAAHPKELKDYTDQEIIDAYSSTFDITDE